MTVEEKLSLARTKLLLKYPFYGIILLKMPLIDTEQFPYMATDYRYIYYNSKNIADWTDRELMFVLCHELFHCIFDHLSRAEGHLDYFVEHPDGSYSTLWNYAADYAVNDQIVRSKIGDMPKFACYNKKYETWHAEKIYDDLIKEAKKNGQCKEVCINGRTGNVIGKGTKRF